MSDTLLIPLLMVTCDNMIFV